ncbi:pentapeptide repeat-containing protein [Streptomyces europaeiscabiei]|uniref:pentapeptide repeat-containing protein n=1 Tax=Streptomyces europaeiscabiei TaxID=146819 RepID=UPI0029ABCECB|nr:pentapeptide repeat-containing protein [Streptomyces europaeiscabiei]MDX3587635.1 pentapeptide repeat-containing protein [Streptomyces europaeiscabiei]
MNPALAVDWTQTRHLPAAGLVLAALVLAGVIWSTLYGRVKSDRRQTARAALGGVAGATIFVLLFWQGPWWFDGLHIRKVDLQPADGVVITGFRTGLVALAAGLIASVTLYYTHRKHQLEQQQFEQAQKQFAENQEQFETTLREAQERDQRQAELTREGQVTGRYVEAIKLLAAEGTHEKLGGIYSLERIMNDSEKDRGTIVEVLAAYIRQRLDGTAPESNSIRLMAEDAAAAEERDEVIDPDQPPLPLVPLPEDVRAALSVLSRNWTKTVPRPDLRSLDFAHWDASEAQLRGAHMPGAELSGAQLEAASLNDADLQGAMLFRTKLMKADLSGTRLDEATLSESNLDKARLVGATLVDANLDDAQADEADFERADLTDACLRRASLKGATFRFATLAEARLKAAHLWNADLTSAIGATLEQVCEAYIYSSTKLPADIANHPSVQARILECEEAKANREIPPAWKPPTSTTSTD